MLGFHDESGVSEKPFVHKTWAPKGQTPYIQSAGSWKNLALSGIIITDPNGKHPRLFLKSIAGTVNADEVIKFFKDLKKHLRGKKILVIWDGLPAHRARKVTAYLETQTNWLKMTRFPSYAPETNPIEYLWSAMKKKYLGNLVPDLKIIGKELYHAKRKLGESRILRGFLEASGLY